MPFFDEYQWKHSINHLRTIDFNAFMFNDFKRYIPFEKYFLLILFSI